MVKKSAIISPDVINGDAINGEKICFIISPIRKKGSPEYTHWRKVRRHIIDKVAIKKGYKTLRSDDVSEPGKITTQIIDLLRNSELVVADLSGKNPNVFYELAIRDAVRKPVILIGESDLDIPFDVRDLRLLKYSLDLDEIEESKTELAKYIDAIEAPAFKVSSPVTMALMTPEDNIDASSQEYFKLILEKISSLSPNIKRVQRLEIPQSLILSARMRKSSISRGEMLAFDVYSSFPPLNSYIEIYDPSATLYLRTEAIVDSYWILVGGRYAVPYYRQTAGGNPMILAPDAPLGRWSWEWYDNNDDELDSGTFTVTP